MLALDLVFGKPTHIVFETDKIRSNHMIEVMIEVGNGNNRNFRYNDTTSIFLKTHGELVPLVLD